MSWPGPGSPSPGAVTLRYAGAARRYIHAWARGIASRHRHPASSRHPNRCDPAFFEKAMASLWAVPYENTQVHIGFWAHVALCDYAHMHHDHSFVAFLRMPRFTGARLIKPPSPTVASTWFSQVNRCCLQDSPQSVSALDYRSLRVISPFWRNLGFNLRLVSRKPHGRTGGPLRFAQQVLDQGPRAHHLQHCPLHHTYAKPKGIVLVEGQRNKIVVFGCTSSGEKICPHNAVTHDLLAAPLYPRPPPRSA